MSNILADRLFEMEMKAERHLASAEQGMMSSHINQGEWVIIQLLQAIACELKAQRIARSIEGR